MTSDNKTTIDENSILHLKLNMPIAERRIEEPFEDYSFTGSSTLGILDLKDAIKHSRNDDKIRGIFLDLRWLISGFRHAAELRSALQDFKSSDKFIIAYSDFMSEGSYYVASVADSIFLHPEGDLEFNGIAYTMSFFKGSLEKLDIEAQIFRVGDYKSAVEPFDRKEMSKENREQVMSFIGDIYNHIISQISETRQLDSEEIKSISSEMKVRNVDDAFALGLIDGLRYSDQVEDLLHKLSDTDKFVA